MRRTSGDSKIRTPYLETALARRPETYGCLDAIAFGFPCQDISIANPEGEGLAGSRSGIFFECMRIVGLLNPSWVIIENVPRLLSINDGRDMAIVLQTLAESGYGWSYRILDSQYFGLAQRRKRLFIVGRFGGACPPEILFQPEGDRGVGAKDDGASSVSHSLNTRSGERQDPSSETFIGRTVTRGTGIHNARNDTIIAKTLGTCGSNSGFMCHSTYIAEAYTEGKREAPGFSRRLDSPRGAVIGNAVSVPVAEWIGKRIVSYEKYNTWYPLLPKLAKWLNHGGEWYRTIIHKDGTEWCVLVALDQGRCMEIVKAGMDGKVGHRIYTKNYKDYSIDLASLSDEGEAAVLEHFERK